MVVSIPFQQPGAPEHQPAQSQAQLNVMDSMAKINELKQLVSEAESINQRIASNDFQIQDLETRYTQLSPEQQNEFRGQFEERIICL